MTDEELKARFDRIEAQLAHKPNFWVLFALIWGAALAIIALCYR